MMSPRSSRTAALRTVSGLRAICLGTVYSAGLAKHPVYAQNP